MAALPRLERLADDFGKLESYRKYRNRLVVAGVGGVAVGTAIALEGSDLAGGLVALAGVGAGHLAMDAHIAVQDARRNIQSDIVFAQNELMHTGGDIPKADQGDS